MKIKKIITLSTVTILLLSTAPIGLISPTVLASETSISTTDSMNDFQEFRFDFQKDKGYSLVRVPKTVIKGGSFRAGMMYNWFVPTDNNVVQVKMTLDNTENAIFTGVEGLVSSDYGLSADGKKLSIIMDAAMVKEGIYGIIQSNEEETISMHITMGYANIDDEGDPTETYIDHDFVINVIDSQVLEEVKSEARAAISNLSNLTDIEKSGFIAQVDVSTSVEMVNEAVTQAQEKDVQSLVDKRAEATVIINELIYLTDIEKMELLGELLTATTIHQIDLVVGIAQEKNETNRISKELIDGKATAKAEIKELSNLFDTEKETYTTQVDAAKSMIEVITAVNKAKAKDEVNLSAAKAAAKPIINELVNLMKEEQASFISELENVMTIADVDSVIASAKSKDSKNLQDVKGKSKEDVDRNSNISKDEKEKFKNEIEKQITTEGVRNVVEESEKLGQKYLADTKIDGTITINQLPNLSNEEKANYNKQVDDSTTIRDVAKAVTEATSKDLLKLEDAKITGKTVINQLPELTDKEKSDYNDQIDLSVTVPEIENVVKDANEKNQLNAVKPGDLNNDGRITIHDFALLKGYLNTGVVSAGINEEKFLKAADVNKDGHISLIDLAVLKKILNIG